MHPGSLFPRANTVRTGSSGGGGFVNQPTAALLMLLTVITFSVLFDSLSSIHSAVSLPKAAPFPTPDARALPWRHAPAVAETATPLRPSASSFTRAVVPAPKPSKSPRAPASLPSLPRAAPPKIPRRVRRDATAESSPEAALGGGGAVDPPARSRRSRSRGGWGTDLEVVRGTLDLSPSSGSANNTRATSRGSATRSPRGGGVGPRARGGRRGGRSTGGAAGMPFEKPNVEGEMAAFWRTVNDPEHPLAMPQAQLRTCAHRQAAATRPAGLSTCVPNYSWTHDRRYIFDAVGTHGGARVAALSPVLPNALEEVFAGPKGGVFFERKTHRGLRPGSWYCHFPGTGGVLVLAKAKISARTLLQRLALLLVTCDVPVDLREQFRRERTLSLTLLHKPPPGLTQQGMQLEMVANASWVAYAVAACLSRQLHVYGVAAVPDPAETSPPPEALAMLAGTEGGQVAAYPAVKEEMELRQCGDEGKEAAKGSELTAVDLAVCTMLSPRLTDSSWADELVTEFIEYHRLVGVGHFFLYVDAHPGVNSTRVWQALARYVEEGVVTLVDWTVKYMLDLRQPTSVNNYHFNTWTYPGAEYPRQFQHIIMWAQTMANHDCMLRTQHLAKWVINCDVDEFFVPKAAPTLLTYLNSLETEKTCHIGVNFQNFLKAPAVLCDRENKGVTFIRRFQHYQPELRTCCKGAGKVIVNPRQVAAVLVHGVECAPDTEQIIMPLNRVPQIGLAHYKAATGRTFNRGEPFALMETDHPILRFDEPLKARLVALGWKPRC